MFNRAWILALAMGFAWHAHAQSSMPDTPEPPPKALMSMDPYEAYAQGRYADAFEGFANLQVKRPKDVDLMLNVGAALYRLKDYAGAQKAWGLAAEHGDPNTRAQALYDMGNSAFQQEHLDEAVQHYQSALSLNPRDEDAKANLHLAKKRLEEQKQQQDKEKDPNAPKSPQDPNQKPDENGSQDPNNKDQSQDPNQTPKAQDGNQQQASDPNGEGQKPDRHDKGEAKDKRDDTSKDAPSADAPQGEDKAPSEGQAEPKPVEDDEGQKTKRMPRSQAERMLDAMGESRPRHAPSKDNANQRPPDGMDW